MLRCVFVLSQSQTPWGAKGAEFPTVVPGDLSLLGCKAEYQEGICLRADESLDQPKASLGGCVQVSVKTQPSAATDHDLAVRSRLPLQMLPIFAPRSAD